jgi:putative transposase
MSRGKRAKREQTQNWGQIEQYCLWPEQVQYELIRPCVLFHESAATRAQETGIPARTISRQVKQFDEQGMVSLFTTPPQISLPETTPSLPGEIRQMIVDLRKELPTMSLREIAEICAVRFDRKPSHHTVKFVLASGQPSSLMTRRYQPWSMITDPAERRLVVVRLHSEGWSVTSIAAYLATSRQTVYATLQRWIEEGVKGLEDKSRARKAPRVMTLAIANEIRKQQENPLIGAWRMHAALLQMHIQVSPRTCGRIMAKHRALYGWEPPKTDDKPKKDMPFRASRRHEFWSIDVRYIEHHQLPHVSGPVYVISVLENFSRMLLASIISEKQDTEAYLRVLALAIRAYGAPEAIVTDSGGIFYSLRALAIYEALDIRKERIDPRQSWQNYIEAHFGIMRRIGDHRINQATSWEEIKQAHRRFVDDYNEQIHFAHQARQDQRHTPKEVLRGILARTIPEPILARIFYFSQITCHLDRAGYLRFRRWRLYAEAGLAKKPVTVHLSTTTLKVAYQDEDLAFYTVTWHDDHQHITDVTSARVLETRYRSSQLTLWTLGPDEWVLFKKLPEYAARVKRKRIDVIQLSLPGMDGLQQQGSVG